MKVWIVFVATTALALAQASAVKGSVRDVESDQPVQYANVVLYRVSDSVQVTGASTDEDGRFVLSPVPPGGYYLEISFIGFMTRRLAAFDIVAGQEHDVGRINLQASAVPVEGKEATAEKPAITRELDKLVVDVSKLPNVTSGTAVEALKDVPSVKVDIDDNVTLRGSSNFTVLVDGRPSPVEGSDALKQIPATTIDKIEIMTNPSVKYSPEGTAGVINVILKKQKGRGLSALANGTAGLTGRYNGDALVSAKRGIASAFVGGFIYRMRSVNRYESESRIFSSSDTLSILTAGSGDWGGLFGNGRGGLDLTFSPRDKSSITARYGGFDGVSNRTGDVTRRHVPGDSTRYGTTGIWDFNRTFVFVTADHEHGLDTSGHKLLGRATLVRATAKGLTGNEEHYAADTSGRRVNEAGPLSRFKGELQYTLPTRGSDKLEAGLEAQREGMDQDYRVSLYDTLSGSYVEDPRSSHVYVGTHDVLSAFATYSLSWRKLGVQPGIRGEYGNRVIKVRDLPDSTWTIKRPDYFPSLHLSYGLPANQQVSASYSRRIDRPYEWYLRPYEVWTDAHNVDRGNPNLRPSYTNSFEAGYELPFGAGSLSATAYLRMTSDLFEWVTVRYPGDTSVILSTARNVGSDRSVGLEFNTNLNPAKWLTANVSGDVYDYHEQGEFDQQSFDKRTLAWSTSVNLSVHPLENTQLQLNGDFSGPGITATGTSSGWLGLDAAVKQSFFSRALSVTLRLGNLLGARPWKSTEQGNGYYSTASYEGEGRVLSLALSWNFNNFRLDPKMRGSDGMDVPAAPGMR